MNNSTCFTETTTICLVWQIIFIILNCLTDSVLQLYLSINMFSFQDLPHLQEKNKIRFQSANSAICDSSSMYVK